MTSTNPPPSPLSATTQAQSASSAPASEAPLPCPRAKSPPPPVSFIGYYHGIPSRPRLLARSDPSPNWIRQQPHCGNFPSNKAIFPIDPDHTIKYIWDFPIGKRLLSIIDQHTPHANSVDILKVCWDWLEDKSPPVVWIGVTPGKVSVETAEKLVKEVMCLLKESELEDVQVEVKESEIFHLVGPSSSLSTSSSPPPPPPIPIPRQRPKARLHHPIYIERGLAELGSRLSTAIGLGITTPLKPDTMGTTAFYLRDRSRPDETLALSAQHVIAGSELDQGGQDRAGEGGKKSTSGLDMFLKHPRSRFQAGKTARQPSTERANRAVRISEQYLDQLSDDLRVTTRRKRDDYSHFDRTANDASRPLRDRDIARYRRDQAEEDFQAMERLLAEIEEHWQGDEDTTLGRLLCCPPVGYGVGSQGRTEDWALIKIDPDKLPSNEYGPLANLLDLTGKYESRVVHRVPGGSVTWGGMLRLQGLLTQADIIHGPINVLMRGAIGGIAKGYLMPVDSMIKPAFARRHGRQKSQEQGKYEGWSREWAAMPPIPRRCEVLPGPFARPGDSGAGVVAEDRRIGGIVTCASGTPPTRLGASANKDVPGRERGEVDITYVTPMHHLLERFVAHGVKDPQFL